MSPKVFISYSWSSAGHQSRIRQWAEQLISEGVDVVLDVWDLKEGDDKFAFMEKMVTDTSVTHVLVFSDSEYAAKADARKAGVGTESQIISREVYAKVQQSKFLPIVCEFDSVGEPLLPTFLKSRIWIDFSSPESANENWEQLIRVLYGRPAYEKPALGQPPSYVTASTPSPANPTAVKFASLKQAVLQNKPTIESYRRDFFDACFSYADSLRTRSRPDVDNMGQRIVEDCGKLKSVRDQVIDWVLLESTSANQDAFDDSLILALERLLELKSRPPEVNSWNEAWFDAHRVFVYETFLYVIAALIRTGSFRSLHHVFSTSFLLPETEGSGRVRFANFGTFYGYSEALQALAPEGKRLFSPAAELIKRQADRPDIPFTAVIEAELLILLMAFITSECRWYPQTLHYSSRGGAFPFFQRAARHRDFRKLATITGIETGDSLRTKVKEGHARLDVNRWHDFWLSDRSFWDAMNMDALDTLP